MLCDGAGARDFPCSFAPLLKKIRITARLAEDMVNSLALKLYTQIARWLLKSLSRCNIRERADLRIVE